MEALWEAPWRQPQAGVLSIIKANIYNSIIVIKITCENDTNTTDLTIRITDGTTIIIIVNCSPSGVRLVSYFPSAGGLSMPTGHLPKHLSCCHPAVKCPGPPNQMPAQSLGGGTAG